MKSGMLLIISGSSGLIMGGILSTLLSNTQTVS
jgi:hypothetical protein